MTTTDATKWGAAQSTKIAFATAAPVQTESEQDKGIPPTREEREQAATAVREMQSVLAPQVEALYDTDSGMDTLEAFDHLGRAADALQYAFPGATGIALAELRAAAELLRNASGRSTQATVGLTPIVGLVEQGATNVETWPTTHAAAKDATAFTSDDARLVLTQPEPNVFILTDNGVEVARFAAEDDALEAVAGYALPDDSPDQGIPFNVFLAPEGVESGDGRLLELGTVTWRDPPLALMMQDTTAHGPGEPAPAWFAGAIENVWRDPADESRILGRGHLAPGADGHRAEGQIRAGMRGVSIDGMDRRPPVVQVQEIDQNGDPVKALVRYGETKIMGATAVPFGAFETCTIWFDDETTPERVTATHGQQIPLDAIPSMVDIEPLEALIAAGGGPAKPPKAWFAVPPPDRYQPVEVSPEGQITGFLGPAGTCHIGIAGKCETIPMSATGYKHFHRTTALTLEGERVPCGWLTMNTGHESTRLGTTAASAIAHYDNTGCQVAKVRIVDTPLGPWMCGAVAPGLDEQTLWKLQGPDVSGDWRPIDGHSRELVAVLAVPLPGFMPKPRPEALVASGRIVAQTGTLPCDDCGPSTVQDFPLDRDLATISSVDGAMLRALRPTALAAIREKVAPAAMIEAAARANEPDPAQAWRDRLRV